MNRISSWLRSDSQGLGSIADNCIYGSTTIFALCLFLSMLLDHFDFLSPIFYPCSFTSAIIVQERCSNRRQLPKFPCSSKVLPKAHGPPILKRDTRTRLMFNTMLLSELHKPWVQSHFVRGSDPAHATSDVCQPKTEPNEADSGHARCLRTYSSN